MEKESKFCKKCGKKIKKEATFCPHCGAKQDQVAGNNTVNSTSNHSKNVGTSIVIVILIGIVLAGFWGYREYPNYRSAQSTANIGYQIAQKDFGKNQVEIHYKKDNNTFFITPKDKYNLDVPDTEEAFKEFITDVKPKMGSKYKSYHTEFLNPENTNRYLLGGIGDSIEDNYIHNYSWDDIFDN